MSYIGKEPQVGGYNMLDSLTASATASYSLTLDSVAFVPESANHLIVSLNGVIQKAGSSFTVSSSTLTFSSALTSSDSIDFVLALGNVLDIGTPSDSTVTNAKTNFVSTSSAAGLQIKGDGTTDGTLQLNCSQNSHGIKLRSPAHSAAASYTLTFPTTDGNADEFLKTDGSGALSWASAGNPTHITRVTNSSNVSTISIQNCFSSSYDVYKVVFYVSTTVANGYVQLRFLKNTSDAFTGTAWNGSLYGELGTTSPTHFDNGGVASSTYVILSHYDIWNGSSSGLAGELLIANPQQTDARLHMRYKGVGDGAAQVLNFDGGWVNSGGEVGTGLQFFSNNGTTNFGYADINVYGYNQ